MQCGASTILGCDEHHNKGILVFNVVALEGFRPLNMAASKLEWFLWDSLVLVHVILAGVFRKAIELVLGF